MNKYMHTIGGTPAFYWNGEQIVYAGGSIKISDMCDSLYMLRKQQKLSTEWRKSQGFSETKYNYIIVKI